MSDENIILKDGVEFIDFINSKEELKKDIEGNFEAPVSNLQAMRISLNNRPCSCGGVNPDAIIAQRKTNLENFYTKWIQSLEVEESQKLKTLLPDTVRLMSDEQILL